MEHEFTPKLQAVIEQTFGELAPRLFAASPLLQYLNTKTRSAERGSKARGAFGNLYALYVLVEDYVNGGYDMSGSYGTYAGAKFTDLLNRQRSLPFGQKLQNHALNHRLNEEFKRYFPLLPYQPVLRDMETNRYWINENLLSVTLDDKSWNLARVVLAIIDTYVETKQTAFAQFITDIEYLQQMQQEPQPIKTSIHFIQNLLRPNVDARIFEITSYAILKAYYAEQAIYWGWNAVNLQREHLKLYKTGRTNANDGGIDFVMRPLGRFFQVTETTYFRKYFLDLDKVQRYPITFVVKTDANADSLRAKIEEEAREIYSAEVLVEKYMNAIEEIITIPILIECLNAVVDQGKIMLVLEDIGIYSKTEFNYLD